CPGHLCDFAFEVDGVVTAESGTSCDYDDYAKLATYLPAPDYAKRFLAFSSLYPALYGDYTNLLWAGYSVDKYPDSPRWFSYVFDTPAIPYAFPYGSATYSKGLLEWSLEYVKTIDVLEFDYCGTYAGTAT